MHYFFRSLASWMYLAVSAIAIGACQPGNSPSNTAAPVPAPVERFDNPNAQILSGVRVPAGKAYFYTSGIVATPADDAVADSLNRYGDTYAQSVSALRRIETVLKEAKLEMKDVIFLRIYLVADPNKGTQTDFDGWFRAYQQFFNNEQNPTKVARTTLAVAALARPELLVEIEAVAVYP